MSKIQVFKLQRPLHGPGNLVLAYNRKETICSQFPMDRKQISEIFGKEYKVYWRGWLKGTIIQLIEKLPHQD